TGKSAKDAAAQNASLYNNYQSAGIGDLDKGLASAEGATQGAISAYAPLSALGAKYGKASDLYMDALGVNGADGNARAVDAFHTGPGYNFAVDQATDAVARKAASLGVAGSGN